MPAHPNPDEFTLDGLTFALRRSPRRRTIGITVARDGSLRLAVPSRCRRRTIEDALRRKLPWVRRKLAEYEAMGAPPDPPRFVTGERLPYRGRWHVLEVNTDGTAPSLALRRGRFELSLPRGDGGGLRSDEAARQARAACVAWYTTRALDLLEQRVAHLGQVLGVEPTGLRVRDMGRRWGTCNSGTGELSFHWETALLPPRILDYIVAHELAHLHEPNHGPGFWRCVEQAIPDWRERRRWLRTDAPAFMIWTQGLPARTAQRSSGGSTSS